MSCMADVHEVQEANDKPKFHRQIKRHQICRYSGSASKPASFNRGFVQGSVIGPTLFLILALDLNTIADSNILIKFADDSTLLKQKNSSFIILELDYTLFLLLF